MSSLEYSTATSFFLQEKSHREPTSTTQWCSTSQTILSKVPMLFTYGKTNTYLLGMTTHLTLRAYHQLHPMSSLLLSTSKPNLQASRAVLSHQQPLPPTTFTIQTTTKSLTGECRSLTSMMLRASSR